MTITGPFYVETPRYRGEHWQVVVMAYGLARRWGFKSEDDARKFADSATADDAE